ncbi:hypothetical protein O3M35_006200 [Rhynocoris fuscipes]|uniref:Protein NRDE2 homolog n=1 Tax=Rhynocoris fuscipes TaxID=488301 RepID=A0AAW1DCQ3_9HEMI
MSLFPAYADDKKDSDDQNKNEAPGPSWLSYPCEALSKQKKFTSSSSEDDTEAAKSSSDRKKRKQKKTKRDKDRKKSKSHEENGNNSLYVLDDGVSIPKKHPPIIKQVTLTKPVYRGNNVQIPKKKRKKKKKDRYFSGKNSKDEEIGDLSEESVISIEEFVKRTEEFNKRLRSEPNNVQLWIDYVNLQDLVAGTKIGRAEKKLSILDKALLENGDSEILLNERMAIYESVYPFEKVSSEAKSLLTKYPRNPVGWRWIIQATQFSLSKMTAPGVLQAYEHVLEGLHRSRQHNTPVFLNILLQCMLFLRQAGLWEQLWLLTELYLELTYTSAGSGAFKINVVIPEEEIQTLEDAVLTSGLTLGALWLRTEHLRECVHFSPVLESPDPQRTVFVDDLSGILFPLGSFTYSRLMCLALISFKVPPLPMTDAFYEYVGLKDISWSLDNVELLLTGCSTNIGITLKDSNYLKPCNDLLVEPQYLNRERIGAKEFFESVDSLFKCCINNCAEEDIASVLAWRIRWWCYVIQHSTYKEETCDIKKELESRGKALLKKHRQCLPLYTEYAIYEAQIGNFSVSLKILETAVSLQQPPLIAGRDRRDICSMYKALVEILLRKDFISNKVKVLKVLIAMSFGEQINNITVTEDLTQKALDRMSHITTEIIREFETNDKMSEDVTCLKEVALTHEIVSWLSCHAWFLYIVKDVWQSCASLEKAIQALESIVNNDLTIGRCILEDLFQTLLSVMYHFCLNSSSQFHVLQEMIDRAIKHFPNNTFFLHLLASTKITSVKWQKIVSNITSTKSPVACSLLIFILRHKLFSEEEQQLISKENAHKRIANLLKKLTKENFSERCPLIWRLTLQSTSNLSIEEIKSTFFLALEKCPWVKMLYYEAAKMLPEDLPQIQDLLVEKELRLHITPEELEILREGPPTEGYNVTSNYDTQETTEENALNETEEQTDACKPNR